MNVKSCAKINLALQITGKREDGYHTLRMINLPLDLHDVIEITPLSGTDSYITCDDIRLMGLRANLCTRALQALRDRYGFKENFRIHIHKEIPFAAGLGGGSSNAAAVLLALNSMLKLKLSKEELAEIGLTLGSDVPFFLDPKPSVLEGIGEKITPISVKKKYICLLVKPDEGLSTKDVYAACDNAPREKINIDAVIQALADGDDKAIAMNRGNDLYPPAKELLPLIGRLAEELAFAFPISGMTGSGSCLFALTTDFKKAKEAEKHYEKAGYITRLTHVL
jgi:4-diphosphocytidyl-2-C-methyl-D-erythritol kinase